MRFLYSLLLYILLPAVLCRLWWRSKRALLVDRGFRQRFGYFSGAVRPGCLWLHAVSVGEVVAASPLIEALLANSDQEILVTTTTSTGKAILQQRFCGQVFHCYIPYDIPGSVQRFLNTIQPSKVIFMEAEIWPNIYHQLSARNIPLYLVNARCSRHSFAGYRYFRALAKQTLSCVKHIGAQTKTDADRYIALGATPKNITITGNLKFDVALPGGFSEHVQQLRSCLGVERKIWVGASTHSGEEVIALAAHRRVLEKYPNVLLVLVPRHPERATELTSLCDAQGFQSTLSGQLEESLASNQQILIVSELGVLISYYGVADVAFIGGSLVDHGGHNPIEAVLAGAPILCGESLDNFKEIYGQLKKVAAVVQVNDERALANVVLRWIDEKPDVAVKAARLVVDGNRGAVNSIMELLV